MLHRRQFLKTLAGLTAGVPLLYAPKFLKREELMDRNVTEPPSSDFPLDHTFCCTSALVFAPGHDDDD